MSVHTSPLQYKGNVLSIDNAFGAAKWNESRSKLKYAKVNCAFLLSKSVRVVTANAQNN